MRVLRMTMVAAIVAMALLVAPSAASAAPSGTQRLTLTTTNFTPGAASGRVVATGTVNGLGTFTQTPGDVFEIVVDLPEGSLFLLVEDTTRTVDTTACVVHFSGGGNVLVTGGTGAFSGASGSGTHSWRGSTGFPKNADGTCDYSAAPRAFIIASAVLDLT